MQKIKLADPLISLDLQERPSSLDILRELSDSDPTLCTVCGRGHRAFLRDLFSPLLDNHDPPAKAA